MTAFDRLCPACKAPVRQDFAFCVQCGAPLAGTEAQPTLTNVPRQSNQQGPHNAPISAGPATDPRLQATSQFSAATEPPPQTPAPVARSQVESSIDPGFPLFRDEPWSARTPTEPQHPMPARSPARSPQQSAPQAVVYPQLRTPEALAPHPAPVTPDRDASRSNRGTVAVIGSLSLALGIGAIVLGWNWLNGGGAPVPRMTTPSASAPNAPGATLAPSPTQTTPNDSTATPPPSTFQLPAGAKACAREYLSDPTSKYQFSAVGNASTTCGFAEAVRQAYIAAGGQGQDLTIAAYSPATNQSYSMACTGGEQVYCRGGTNALVILYR